MRVLVLGSGAREHTLAWCFSRSKRITGLFIAPGNAGTSTLGENVPDTDPENPEQVYQLCVSQRIDLVFVGPEAPLAAGVVDYLRGKGIDTIGPHQEAALLESSKAFSKKFMIKNKIPTAKAKEISRIEQLEKHLRFNKGTIVLKKSGLAAGKGVLVTDDRNEAIQFAGEVLKSDSLLIEECLEGQEVSIFALTDGKDYVLLPPCADFKRAHEDDAGPNTGGMGAVCPVPVVDKRTLESINRDIIETTFAGMEKQGLSYKGVLYFGIMLTKDGPKVLEYNVRFGDPETQVLLPLIESDFGDLAEALIQGDIGEFPLGISSDSCLGVVVASGGYPGQYKKGVKVESLPKNGKKTLVFHASTELTENGDIVTGGGRCFTVVGLGDNILKASTKAYEAVAGVSFKGSWYRGDIGKKFFIE